MRRVSLKRFLVNIREERGASAVIVAVLMVALLGFAAISVDVGRLYWEKAELQNGADTAALSIATACAKSDSDAGCTSPVSTAQSLANVSSTDGASAVESATVNTLTGTVTVMTAASETGASAGMVSLWFARIFGLEETRVVASAKATWGYPAGGPGFPLAIDPCEIDFSGNAHLIRTHGGNDCNSNNSSSGQTGTGNFAWLQPDAGKCSVTVVPGTTTPGYTGIPLPDPCKASGVLETMHNKLIYLPVYTSSDDRYTIAGFAAMELLGYSFPSKQWNNAGQVDGITCTDPCRGIIGKFVRYVPADHDFELGGENYGVWVVKLTE